MHFISVIIPTYNRAEYLNELLDALVNQTFKNFEVLVCDDGSSDNTKEIVERFMDKLDIRYFFENNWGGPARPRNIGIKNATSNWLCFVDSDDLWYESKLLEVSKIINKDVDIIYHLFKISNSQTVIGHYHQSLFFSVYEDLLFSGNSIVNSSICVKKSFIEGIGGFDENKQFIAVEDYDLLLRLAKNGARFHLIKKVLGEYRINESNISKDFAIQIKKIKLLLNSHSSYTPNPKINALVAYMKAGYLISRQRNRSARKFLFNGFLYGSFAIKIKSLVKLVKTIA